MADVINLMDYPVVVGVSTTKAQPVEQAMDVGGYDKLDLAIDTPGHAPNEVKILTSMTLQEDDADWVEAASSGVGVLGSNTANFYVAVPNSGKPLFRYIRWKIVGSSTNISSTRITGVARQG